MDYLQNFPDVKTFPFPLGIKMTPYNELFRSPVEFPSLWLKGTLPHASAKNWVHLEDALFDAMLRKIKGLAEFSRLILILTRIL